jgi:hypothetical protein
VQPGASVVHACGNGFWFLVSHGLAREGAGRELLATPSADRPKEPQPPLASNPVKELQATPLQASRTQGHEKPETRNASSRFVTNCWKKTKALVLSIV